MNIFPSELLASQVMETRKPVEVLIYLYLRAGHSPKLTDIETSLCIHRVTLEKSLKELQKNALIDDDYQILDSDFQGLKKTFPKKEKIDALKDLDLFAKSKAKEQTGRIKKTIAREFKGALTEDGERVTKYSGKHVLNTLNDLYEEFKYSQRVKPKDRKSLVMARRILEYKDETLVPYGEDFTKTRAILRHTFENWAEIRNIIRVYDPYPALRIFATLSYIQTLSDMTDNGIEAYYLDKKQKIDRQDISKDDEKWA